MGMVNRAGVLSSLVALASAGSLIGQEPLVLDNLEFICPPDEACTVTFDADPGLQIVVLASSDLDCWVFAGGCTEVDLGDYQFVDFGAVELPQRFYRFGVFDQEVPLPPQFEQIRLELGDEQFGQWLQSNMDQFGSLQGFPPEQVEEMDPEILEQFEEVERILDLWLKDLLNVAEPLLPELELPPHFEQIRIDWGDYDFSHLLVENLDQWGNFQGICEPLVIEWEQNEPIIFENYLDEEQALGLWFEDYVLELPPVVLEIFPPQQESLPPQYEQLRLELGDEGFAQWLQSNFEQFGNLQGIPEGDLPAEGSEAREHLETVESILDGWLREFEDHE